MKDSQVIPEEGTDYGKTSNYLVLEDACQKIARGEIKDNEFLSTLTWMEDLISAGGKNKFYINEDEAGAEVLISARKIYLEGIEVYKGAIYELRQYLKNRDLSNLKTGLSMALEANRKLTEVQHIAKKKTQQLEESENFFKQQQMLTKNMSVHIFSTLNYIHSGSNIPVEQSKSKTDIFTITPLFDVLTKEEIEKILKRIKYKKHEKNTLLFKEGDKSTEVYIIKTGEIKLYKPLADNNRIEFPLLGTGDVFGEMGIITNAPRSLSAMVSSDIAEVYIISRDSFLHILKSYPELNLNLSRMLCERISETNKRLAEYLS